jgi:hypothetical protein
VSPAAFAASFDDDAAQGYDAIHLRNKDKLVVGAASASIAEPEGEDKLSARLRGIILKGPPITSSNDA